MEAPDWLAAIFCCCAYSTCDEQICASIIFLGLLTGLIQQVSGALKGISPNRPYLSAWQ